MNDQGAPEGYVPTSNQGYNPDVFALDEAGDYGMEQDIMILSHDHKELGVVKSIGGGNNKAYTSSSRDIPDDIKQILDDDEYIIQHFIENNKKQVLCEYFALGNCKYGEKCAYLHPKGHMNQYVNQNYKFNADEDADCSVCLDRVLAKGKQFGILEACDHVFCLQCIRGWRATFDKKTTK